MEFQEAEDRFWEKVDRGEGDDCWEWEAATARGYGRFRLDGQLEYAHRVAYALSEEPPGDLLVLHTCDNRVCVNPSHLYAGDHSDNLQDAYDRGRLEPPRVTGESNGNAKLTEEDVLEVRERAADGEAYQSLADEFGVARSSISDIVSRKKWSHLEGGASP